MDHRGLSGTLEELNLLLVILEDWILIQRASIDIHINEEPYHSIQVYANTMTKKYVVRAWGRSIQKGDLTTMEDLKELCIDNFGRSVACAGYLGRHPGHGLDLVRVSYPCTRWISKSCEVTFAHDQDALIIGLCPACSGEDLMKKEADDKTIDHVEKSLAIEEKKNLKSPKCNLNSITEKTSEEQETDSKADDTCIAPEHNHADDSDDEAWLPPKPKPKEIKKKLKPKTQVSERRHALRKKVGRLKNHGKENGIDELQHWPEINHAKSQPPSKASTDWISPQTCDQCGLVLKSLSILQYHMKAIHSTYSDREHKCEHEGCSKAFITSSQLRLHYKSVHGEGFMCDHCGKRLCQKGALENHIKMVHKKQPLNLKCNYCDEVFRDYSTKRWHTNIVHFPDKYRCHICQRSCASEGRLKLHIATHGTPKFDCAECGKSLMSEYGLKVHMRLHTGDKPYKCAYCTWEGITSSQLNRHKMRSHKQECEREQSTKQQQQQNPEQLQQQIKTQPLDDGMVVPSAPNMFLTLGASSDSPASAS